MHMSNVSTEELRNQLQAAGVSEVIISRVLKESQSGTTKLDLTKVLSSIGLVLIAAAVIVVVASQWQNVSPLTRICFLFVPFIGLLIASRSLRPNPRFQDIADGTLLTAGIILPFGVGTFFYQLQIISQINANLILLSSLLGAAFFTYIERQVELEQSPLLTLLCVYIALGAALSKVGLSYQSWLWILAACSLTLTAFSLSLAQKQYPKATGYLGFTTLVSALLLPAATIASLSPNYGFEQQTLTISCFSLLYLVGAVGYARLYQLWEAPGLYLTKRGLEELAPLVLLIPLFVLSISDQGAFSWGLIGLSIPLMLLSGLVRIQSLLVAPAVGIVIGILSLTASQFLRTLGWPISIFLCGFLVLGVAVLIRQLRQHSKETTYNSLLGEDLAVEAKLNPRSFRRTSLWLLIVLLILGPPLLFDGAGLFNALFFHQKTEAPTHQPVPPPKAPVSTPSLAPNTYTLSTPEQTITTHVRQPVTLILPYSDYTFNYTTDGQVDLGIHSSTSTEQGLTRQTLRFDYPGQETLHYTVKPSCSSGKLCPQYILGFTVHLNVLP